MVFVYLELGEQNEGILDDAASTLTLFWAITGGYEEQKWNSSKIMGGASWITVCTVFWGG